jgi:hypothetical protein
MLRSFQDNRAAHDATVTQQRELMRYMSDLNDWLERDVNDRQAEIRGVNARIENLRQDLGDMFTAGRSGAVYLPFLYVSALNYKISLYCVKCIQCKQVTTNGANATSNNGVPSWAYSILLLPTNSTLSYRRGNPPSY